MDILDRAKILAAHDFKIKAITVPEWGGDLNLRTFDGATRARLLQPEKDGTMPADWMERVIVAAACDPGGHALFSEKDIEALGKKSAAVLERVFTEAVALNGLTADAVENDTGEFEPTRK